MNATKTSLHSLKRTSPVLWIFHFHLSLSSWIIACKVKKTYILYFRVIFTPLIINCIFFLGRMSWRVIKWRDNMPYYITSKVIAFHCAELHNKLWLSGLISRWFAVSKLFSLLQGKSPKVTKDLVVNVSMEVIIYCQQPG